MQPLNAGLSITGAAVSLAGAVLIQPPSLRSLNERDELLDEEDDTEVE